MGNQTCLQTLAISLCPHFWVNYNDLTATSLGTLVYFREIIPFYGLSIQVSELSLIIIYPDISPCPSEGSQWGRVYDDHREDAAHAVKTNRAAKFFAHD